MTTKLLGTKKVKLPPPSEEVALRIWTRVMCDDGEETWKVVVSKAGQVWKYDLWQRKLNSKTAWVRIGDCFGDSTEYKDHTAYFCVSGLPGELRVTWEDGEDDVYATVLLTDENDDGPYITLGDAVCVVFE
jgi:hypothetical protein